MPRFRERVAAAIALLVVAAGISMMFLAFRYIDEKEKFDRAKDLLLIVNSVLGVVIGYYFNKVSTEARAENAESTARTATASAREAADARNAAQADAQETRTHLDDVSRAAEKVLAAAPASPRTLGMRDAADPGDAARAELEAALARARRKSPA